MSPVNNTYRRSTEPRTYTATEKDIKTLKQYYIALSRIYKFVTYTKDYYNCLPKNSADDYIHMNLGDVISILEHTIGSNSYANCVSIYDRDNNRHFYSDYIDRPDPLGDFISNVFLTYKVDIIGEYNRDLNNIITYKEEKRDRDTLLTQLYSGPAPEIHIEFPAGVFRIYRKDLEFSDSEYCRAMSMLGQHVATSENYASVFPANEKQFDDMYSIVEHAESRFNGYGNEIIVYELSVSIKLSNVGLINFIDNKLSNQIKVIDATPVIYFGKYCTIM